MPFWLIKLAPGDRYGWWLTFREIRALPEVAE